MEYMSHPVQRHTVEAQRYNPNTDEWVAALARIVDMGMGFPLLHTDPEDWWVVNRSGVISILTDEDFRRQYDVG